MKARNILIFILGALIFPAYLASCGEDRWAAYAEQTKTDLWIDDTMRVWYYWNENMPASKYLNYFSAPSTFFTSLLSSSDKFSSIDSLTSAVSTRSIPYTDYSYGFQFTTNRVEDNDTALYAHVLYVADESPASAINLKRGDWIMDMNGEPITSKNYAKLYGSAAMQLTVGYYDADNDTIVAYNEPRQIVSARSINDNPVHYTNVYTSGSKKIGYLVYNHFSSGVTESSQEYNNNLRKAFREFSSQGVSEFILDLRYNNGGLLSCAELLCAMLAPASAFGQELGYLEFNNRTNPRNVPFTLNKELIQNGANLNLSTLYVLTSNQTASASEMVINCLKPLMNNVIIIGSTTVGKNVGSLTFSNPDLKITMSPIVCKIYNSEGKSDYESGFTPQYSVSENNDMARFLPFGNTNEIMLATALELISKGTVTKSTTNTSPKTAVINNSIERRANHSVKLNKKK